MNKARLIITAINVEKITQAEAVRRYGVSQSTIDLIREIRAALEKAGITNPRNERIL